MLSFPGRGHCHHPAWGAHCHHYPVSVDAFSPPAPSASTPRLPGHIAALAPHLPAQAHVHSPAQAASRMEEVMSMSGQPCPLSGALWGRGAHALSWSSALTLSAPLRGKATATWLQRLLPLPLSLQLTGFFKLKFHLISN